MIITQVMGNLGNQLFIYGMARSLQLESQDKLILDLKGLKRFYYSSAYRLDHINMPNDISCDYESVPRKIRKEYERTSKLYHIEQRIYVTVRKDGLIPDAVTQRWFERGCYYNFSRSYFEYPQSNKKNKFVYGYFQSEKYFKKHADIIKKECKVIDEYDDYDKKMMPEILSSNSVGVSIRAINEIGVTFIDYDYYYRAMELISKKIENPRFFVFSDDIEATKEKLKFHYPVTFVSPTDSCHGLRLLYNCKHYIIANSTFSWWGAYLSDNKNKIIIMPDTLDKEGVGRDDYFLEGSIRLPCSFVKYKVDADQIIHQKYAK